MKILITIYFLFILFNISSAQDSLSIIPAEGFPKWLKTAEGSTDQTSGIAFIRSDERGTHFLLADDTGTLHHLIINSDSLLTLRKIILSREVQQYISPFPKKDFEEILYDRHTGKVFLSIEGNYPSVKQVAGLYQIKFKNNDVLSDTVISIEKIKIQPEEKFLQYVDNNVCFEGLAADENYIYAALEGFSKGFFFADSTLIYVLSKKDFSIKKIVSTRNTGIATICGLYSDGNLSFYGVDRNNKNIFYIELSDDLEIKNVRISKVPTAVPNYKSFDYVVSFESITMDENKNIYLVDDPWKKFYAPSDNILNKLDEETIRNFKKFVPVIYKFKLNE